MILKEPNNLTWTHLIWFVEHNDWALEFWSWGVLKIFNILGDDLSVCNQISLFVMAKSKHIE